MRSNLNVKHQYLVQLHSVVRHSKQNNHRMVREYNQKQVKKLKVPKYKGTKYRGFDRYSLKIGAKHE